MDGIDVILFDLGGVLVELAGVPDMVAWTGNTLSEKQLWKAWMNSPSVRSFEKGDSTTEQFAESLIKEMALPVGKAEFIERFTYWPKGLFPGVRELVGRLGKQKTLACFSNTNELHWPRLIREMGIETMFAHRFASHEIGKLKPDRDAFEYVLERLGCSPSSVMFFDDNRSNVESAIEVGMVAYRVNGPEQIEAILGGLP